MNDFVQTLELELKRNSNAKIAAAQKAYMRNQFEFYGIKSPLRREIQKPFLAKSYLPPKSELEEIVKALWNKPQREYQYIALLEFMVTHKSW